VSGASVAPFARIPVPPPEDPLSGFMRHATVLVGSVTKMGWQVSGSPAISPDADGGGEVTLTLRLAHRRQVHVFAVDEWL